MAPQYTNLESNHVRRIVIIFNQTFIPIFKPVRELEVHQNVSILRQDIDDKSWVTSKSMSRSRTGKMKHRMRRQKLGFFTTKQKKFIDDNVL